MKKIYALSEKLNLYEEKVEFLFKPDQGRIEQILEVLSLRDEIEVLLLDDPIELDTFRRLKQIDEQFKGFENEFSNNEVANEIKELCQVKKPPEHYWWWWNLRVQVHPSDRLDPLWNILALTCSGFSFAMIARIIPLLIQVNPLLGSLQTGLTFLIGKSLLDKHPGDILNGLSQRIARFFGSDKSFHAELKLILSIMTVLAVSGIDRAILPAQANQFIQEGLNHSKNGDLLLALRKYKQAQILNPDAPNLQVSLGYLYERLGNLAQARAFYEQAIEQEDCPETYNNLGRLLVLAGDYPGANNVLNQAQKLAEKPEMLKNCKRSAGSLEYEVSKNLGWLRLENKDLLKAKNTWNKRSQS
ncbi:MAG: tetratricopeptide repeat protein, partial [Oscillatoriales cyanobacterium SM2_3_0]|nr:tetratricopeptide repeat protein [Oscillatoriales cyanobacterium SM2_3_0]